MCVCIFTWRNLSRLFRYAFDVDHVTWLIAFISQHSAEGTSVSSYFCHIYFTLLCKILGLQNTLPHSPLIHCICTITLWGKLDWDVIGLRPPSKLLWQNGIWIWASEFLVQHSHHYISLVLYTTVDLLNWWIRWVCGSSELVLGVGNEIDVNQWTEAQSRLQTKLSCCWLMTKLLEAEVSACSGGGCIPHEEQVYSLGVLLNSGQQLEVQVSSVTGSAFYELLLIVPPTAIPWKMWSSHSDLWSDYIQFRLLWCTLYLWKLPRKFH